MYGSDAGQPVPKGLSPLSDRVLSELLCTCSPVSNVSTIVCYACTMYIVHVHEGYTVHEVHEGYTVHAVLHLTLVSQAIRIFLVCACAW